MHLSGSGPPLKSLRGGRLRLGRRLLFEQRKIYVHSGMFVKTTAHTECLWKAAGSSNGMHELGCRNYTAIVCYERLIGVVPASFSCCLHLACTLSKIHVS